VDDARSCAVVERLVKTLLWVYGGHCIHVHGSGAVFRHLRDAYAPGAARKIGEGIPLVVANDGDVTALAGAMDLNENGAAGIALGDILTPAEKLSSVQRLMAQDDPRAQAVYETIGVYLGYSIAYYARFYAMRHVLLMGRVTSGKGGAVLLKRAREVLKSEFSELSGRVRLHLPDESSRRVGQAIAAASLPERRAGGIDPRRQRCAARRNFDGHRNHHARAGCL